MFAESLNTEGWDSYELTLEQVRGGGREDGSCLLFAPRQLVAQVRFDRRLNGRTQRRRDLNQDGEEHEDADSVLVDGRRSLVGGEKPTSASLAAEIASASVIPCQCSMDITSKRTAPQLPSYFLD